MVSSIDSARKITRVAMLLLAFLLPFVTWPEAAGCVILALMFILYILPLIAPDSGQVMRPSTAASEAVSLGGAANTVGTSQSSAVSANGMAAYPLSILGLILLYRHHLEVVALVWAILAVASPLSMIASEALGGPSLPFNPGTKWSGVTAFVISGGLGAGALALWMDPKLGFEKALALALATAVVGAIVQSASIKLECDLSISLICSGFAFCAYFVSWSALGYNLPYLKIRLIAAVAFNVLFALIALRMHLVNRSGAGAGLLLGVAVYAGYGYKSFLILFAFFVLGSAATKLGYARKAALGVAERRGGARSWREATANLLAPAFFSILVIATLHQRAFLLALVAALAEAAGDTISSEIGQVVGGRAYRITTLQPVPVGENGGVSLAGTSAGLGASALIAALGYALGLVTAGGAVIAASAGLAGNLFDSLLGATIERRGSVTNGIVNFAGTTLAGSLALAVYLQIGF